MMVLTSASPEIITRLLALLMLDKTERILHAQMMPSRPATAILLPDGQIREGRGRFLAPWALAEIDRLAAVLLAEHAEYVSDLTAALQLRPNSRFTTAPPDFVFAEPLVGMRVGPSPPSIEVDISQSERVQRGLAPYQVEKLNYLRNPYLLQLTDDQLMRRMEDILANVHVINERGLISLDSSDPTLRYWMSLTNDIAAEMARRHGPYPAGWHGQMIDGGNLPGSLARDREPRAKVLRPAAALPATYFVKYGELRYLEAALREGKLRIAPASRYNDPSLNPAIRDDELTIDIAYDPYVPFNPYPPGTVLLPPSRVPLRKQLNTNYYVYCIASTLSMRLLYDFGAEACIVFRDPNEFLARLCTAMRKCVPGWRCTVGDVSYLDPLQVNPSEVDVLMGKHFRYAYQREVRVAWLPPAPTRQLEPLFLSVGSLEDIAELITPTEV
ncbi:MAG TPA: hypothetical protein VFK04_15500 [Gemmatimonadaceae bacterium]|nr:hypothetical protein [Gemmatimonadaceae bacterium]